LAVGLIVSRMLHYVAVSILFGAALFPRYATGALAPSFVWLPRLLQMDALLVIASAVFWLIFAVAVSNDSLAGGLELSALSATLAQTNFGHIWIIRLVLAVVLAAALYLRPNSGGYPLLLGAAILLVSLAATGRAETDTSEAAAVHVVLDAVHLLAASVWIGALVVFAAMLARARHTRSPSDTALVARTLSRFSQVGTGVVAVLLSSGLLNPNILVSFGTPFGQILLAKLFLFAGMLACAAANRFWLTPKLEFALASDGSPQRPLRALYGTILVETILALLIFLAVAWLGILSPGGA
jgi:putative copper resistance protein D